MPPAFNWKPYAIGLAVTLAVIAVGWIAVRRPALPSGDRDDGYAAQVAITDAKVLAAQSMMAGGVVYYDGTLDNRGDRTLTGYTVELTFRDPDGKVIAREQRSLLDNRFRPLAPHAQRSFEIGFDQVAPGWNQVPPEPRAVAVYVR